MRSRLCAGLAKSIILMRKISNKVIKQIQAEYLAQFVIPKKISQLQYLLCPVGLVGAGKTTVLKPLARRLNLIRISTDEIRKLLADSGFGYDFVAKIVENIATKFLREGHSLALDADCAGKNGKELIKKAVKKFGVKIIWIHINPPENFIINKLLRYKHTWLFKNPEEAIQNYFARKSLHKYLNMPFVYTFDTSKNNLTKQISEAAILIEKALK